MTLQEMIRRSKKSKSIDLPSVSLTISTPNSWLKTCQQAGGVIFFFFFVVIFDKDSKFGLPTEAVLGLIKLKKRVELRKEKGPSWKPRNHELKVWKD